MDDLYRIMTERPPSLPGRRPHSIKDIWRRVSANRTLQMDLEIEEAKDQRMLEMISWDSEMI